MLLLRSISPLRSALPPSFSASRLPFTTVMASLSSSSAPAPAATPFPPSLAASILSFWFGPEEGRVRSEWFRKSDAFDADIRARFLSALDAIARGAGLPTSAEVHAAAGAAAAAAPSSSADPSLAVEVPPVLTLPTFTPGSKEDAHTLLAYIVCVDQFPRNLFRNSPHAFAFDALALHASLLLVDTKSDQLLHRTARSFAYMPFQHSESLAIQERSLEIFNALTPNHEYAQKHHAIIARFGRFPHRNDVLGRPSTQEEIDFLKTPGSSF